MTDHERELTRARVTSIQQAIDEAPKTSKWKLRARVGDRVRWYEDPEEVERHGY
jgi:hypothetical protein